ncbi:phosphatase PAP2 family protein [Phenylobacterium montanum]|uniref:Phosphatase PAP2 family protein n=1 Tax=Phenylobacterium montanum TaxID=2823693 RepID=A0A975FVX7_9CAUL|nr:phosphatase PAP2 family protein [Caulobacter sp. S6]QUD86290.1 phosphatase PAP2 family protein [Caulobacter sp. S6]
MFPRELILTMPYIYLWFSQKTPESRARLVAGLGGAILSIGLARLIAHFAPFEVRPMYDAASGFHKLAVDRAADMEGWSAFPSDTAAFSIALTLGLFTVSRTASVALTLLSMAFFGLARVYLGIHYPLDVAAGWLIGGLAAALAQTPPIRGLAGSALRVEARAPPLFYACAAMVLTETGQMFDNVRDALHLLHMIA